MRLMTLWANGDMEHGLLLGNGGGMATGSAATAVPQTCTPSPSFAWHLAQRASPGCEEAHVCHAGKDAMTSSYYRLLCP